MRIFVFPRVSWLPLQKSNNYIKLFPIILGKTEKLLCGAIGNRLNDIRYVPETEGESETCRTDDNSNHEDHGNFKFGKSSGSVDPQRKSDTCLNRCESRLNQNINDTYLKYCFRWSWKKASEAKKSQSVDSFIFSYNPKTEDEKVKYKSFRNAVAIRELDKYLKPSNNTSYLFI